MALKPTKEDIKCGFNGTLHARDNVVLLPGNSDIQRPRQIIDPAAKEWIYWDASICQKPLEGEPLEGLAETITHKPGRYVFGGYVRVHFGHFLVECISPLWALDHAGDVDGILFFPYHTVPNVTPRAVEVMDLRTDWWIKALGVDLPFEILRTPTKVDHLVVGENGFGFGDKFSGSSFFHEFVRKRNALPAKELAKKTRTKIYVSRAKLGARKGQIVGEDALQRTFEEAGYQLYSPEADPVEVQLATYASAEAIVGVEGSALHLPPVCCPTDTKVAIIARRSKADLINTEFGAQFRGFAQVDPLITSDITSSWALPGARGTNIESLAVIDFEQTYQKLIAAGFLSASDKLYYPTPQDLTDQITKASMGHGAHLHIVNLDHEITAHKTALSDRQAAAAARRQAETPAAKQPGHLPAANAPSSDSRIEINIAGGHQLRVVGGYDPEALAHLIRGLSK